MPELAHGFVIEHKFACAHILSNLSKVLPLSCTNTHTHLQLRLAKSVHGIYFSPLLSHLCTAAVHLATA